MRGKIVLAGLILSLSGLVTSAQSQSTAAPTEGDSTAPGQSPRSRSPKIRM